MTVSIHVAPHPNALISLVCGRLASTPDDAFASELIAVPTRGIERWMTQQIATELAAQGKGGDGISAGIEFPSPFRLVRDVLPAVPPLDIAAAPSIGRLLGEIDEPVLPAAALAVRGTRFGHVCVRLDAVRDAVVVDGQDPEVTEALHWPDPDE